jgi:hypothetical protein
MTQEIKSINVSFIETKGGTKTVNLVINKQHYVTFLSEVKVPRGDGSFWSKWVGNSRLCPGKNKNGECYDCKQISNPAPSPSTDDSQMLQDIQSTEIKNAVVKERSSIRGVYYIIEDLDNGVSFFAFEGTVKEGFDILKKDWEKIRTISIEYKEDNKGKKVVNIWTEGDSDVFI